MPSVVRHRIVECRGPPFARGQKGITDMKKLTLLLTAVFAVLVMLLSSMGQAQSADPTHAATPPSVSDPYFPIWSMTQVARVETTPGETYPDDLPIPSDPDFPGWSLTQIARVTTTPGYEYQGGLPGPSDWDYSVFATLTQIARGPTGPGGPPESGGPAGPGGPAEPGGPVGPGGPTGPVHTVGEGLFDIDAAATALNQMVASPAATPAFRSICDLSPRSPADVAACDAYKAAYRLRYGNPCRHNDEGEAVCLH